ncbi:MAG: PCRF domain-containing protein, partial [Planctomycetota bacterium]
MPEKRNNFLAKLDELHNRYSEVERQIADAANVSDPNKLIALSKEQGKLKKIVAKYREYKKAAAGIEEANEILNDLSTDDEVKGLAKEEIKQLEEEKKGLLDEIQNALVMADDEAINSIIMEIRAGTGGEEAALFVRDLYEMYLRYAERRKWKVEQLDFGATEMGGFREVILSIKGAGVWAGLGYEGGGHRVQRVPET